VQRKDVELKHHGGAIFALILVLGLCCVGGCGSDDEGSAASVQEANAAPAVFGIGSEAPDFVLKDLAGVEVKLSSLRGKAVIVDFWATWCGPCRAVMPHLQALSEEYAGQLEILAVSLDQAPGEAVPPFAEKHGLTFTMLADTRAPQVASQWGGVNRIPTSFLVSPDGKVAYRWQGVHQREEYEQQIRKVLGLS
jgi:peroxiredoxin